MLHVQVQMWTRTIPGVACRADNVTSLNYIPRRAYHVYQMAVPSNPAIIVFYYNVPAVG
jgi:hypothetical protein